MFKQISWELFETLKKPLLLVLAFFVLILILVPPLTYVYFAQTLTSKESIINNGKSGVVLLDRNEKPFFTFYAAKNTTITPISHLPNSLQKALIASEDRDFYSHPGFSVKAMLRSFIEDIQEQRLAFGGSTITQQLVKNALLTPQKSFLRKYQELVLSYEVERRYNKDEILEMYLNSVYFGEGAVGAENAAQTYFGKHANELSLGESALLAAILPAPSELSPISGDKTKALKLQKVVLQKMYEQGYITQQQKTQAEQETITFSTQKETINVVAPHFALMVKDELIKKYGEDLLARAGFTVKTTLDLSWQTYAETVVKNQVARLESDHVTNGAAVAIDPKTGEIRVLVGSADWNNESFGKLNIVTRGRQPGSSFKPLIYAKAFEQRAITPSTILSDRQTTFENNYTPKDYDNTYRGDVLPRRALANSLNIPAVEVLESIGIDSGIDTHVPSL